MRAVALISAPEVRHARPFLGKPLVLWAVEAALEANAFERVVVSTANPEVIDALRGTPGIEITSDEIPTGEFDLLLRLGLHAPLIRPEELRAALDRCDASGVPSLVSVASLKGDLHVENGAIEIVPSPWSNAAGCGIYTPEPERYEMGPETLLDLDTAEGWAALEAIATVRRREAFHRAHGERLRRIRLVLSDVDGVMTDAGMIYGEGGDESKRFNTRDGKGFEIVRNLGLKTGIVTTENTALVARRAAKLRVDYLHQGIERKDESLAAICGELGIEPSEVAYIGDDVNDSSILSKVGFAACPADAVGEVKMLAHHVCRAKGGEGAVRELCDYIASAHRA